MTKFPIKPTTPAFMCEVCHEVFPINDPTAYKTAQANYEANKDKLPLPEGEEPKLGIVCHDCWILFADWYEKNFGEKLVR